MTSSRWDPLAQLSETQRKQITAYESMLARFNRRLNLISPETTDDIRGLHTRHSLCILRRSFPEGASVVDWGTGGGLPAIPLAIACPHLTVFAVDSVGKKVRAVRTFARRLELDNLFGWDGRAENWTGAAHYSVSRATAPLADLWSWHSRVVEPFDGVRADDWPQGLVCLKGGDLSGEIQDLHDLEPAATVSEEPIFPLLGDDHFRHKYIVSVDAAPAAS
jgi:16S rRNA (guanine527-N7)-methyltransferase